jgi:hypothetical protein
VRVAPFAAVAALAEASLALILAAGVTSGVGLVILVPLMRRKPKRRCPAAPGRTPAGIVPVEGILDA